MRALVTSSRAPHSLAAIRELGKRGWQVTAADHTRLSPGLYSRYVDRKLLMPNLTTAPAAWAETLCEELKSRPYQLLFPSFEEIFVVARLGEQVTQHTRIMLPSYDTMIRVHHKARLAELAKKLGVETPESWHPQSAVELEALLHQLPFPVVLKLPMSNNSFGMVGADTQQSLRRHWNRLTARHQLAGDSLPIIQRRIEGDVLCSLSFARRGEVLGRLIYRPVLMFPDQGGTAFVRESIRHPKIEAVSDRFLSDLEWDGFLGCDFIVETDTGKALLIDANPRPNPALHLGQRAGVDFIGILDDLHRNREPQRFKSPQTGLRSRILFVHLLWLTAMLLPGRRWWQRIKRAFASLESRIDLSDVHDSNDRKPSWIMSLYVPYFIVLVEALRPLAGGFMFGCNYNRRLTEQEIPDHQGKNPTLGT